MRKTALGLVALLSLPAIANAVPVTWNFEGNVYDIGLPGGVCVAIGCQDLIDSKAAFSGTITFDYDTLDSNPDPLMGLYDYNSAPYGIKFTIGDYTSKTNNFRVSIVAADIQSRAYSQYNFYSEDLNGNFSRVGLTNCYWFDRAPLISTDAQAAQPIVASHGCSDPTYFTTKDGADLALNVSRYWINVPEPATFGVFSLAALLGAALRRR